MKYVYAFLLLSITAVPVLAETVDVEVKMKKETKTFRLSSSPVNLFSLSLDMSSGGINYEVDALCKDGMVVITEKNGNFFNDINTEDMRKTQIPLNKLPYVISFAASEFTDPIWTPSIRR